jgi:hypothetical protein
MWKRLLETSKQAATVTAGAAAPKPATSASAAATAPKSAKPKRATPAANAPPKLSTLKNYSSSRRAAVTSATAVSQASLLRLKQAAASKKTVLPSSVPYPHAQGNNRLAPLGAPFLSLSLSLSLPLSLISPCLVQMRRRTLTRSPRRSCPS